ncbi:hypothetical protein FOA52_001509 [Chlamydomonas sp. UWO 241]|nr:hypothetical protein FOA52_001509 [Chlamydomonas sp. UWO 241]
MQRQVALLGEELRVRGRVVAEAEAALLELSARLATISGQPAGNEGDASTQVLAASAVVELRKFAKRMLARLKSERQQAAKQLTRSGTRDQERADGAPRWEMPFIAAGGNRFLAASQTTASDTDAEDHTPGQDQYHGTTHTPPSVHDLVTGGAACALSQLLAAAGGGNNVGSAAGVASGGDGGGTAGRERAAAAIVEIQGLEARLCELGPRLSSVALLLRTTVLPGMPWLGVEDVERVTAEIAAAAAAAADAARPLTELAALMPAGAALLAGGATSGGGASGGEAARRSSIVSAQRDAWLWSQGGEHAATPADDATTSGTTAAEDTAPSDPTAPLLGIDLERMAASIFSVAFPQGAPRRAQFVAALNDTLRRHVGARAAAAACRQRLLTSELLFAARSNAAAAQAVSRLVLATVEVVEESGTSARSGTRGSASASPASALLPGAAALRGVLSALDNLDRSPCEDGLRGLVAELRTARQALAPAASAMEAAGLAASDVEARLVKRLAGLNRPFADAMEELDRQRQAARRAYVARGGGGGGGGAAGDGGGDKGGAGGRLVLPWDVEVQREAAEAAGVGAAAARARAGQKGGAARAGAARPLREWME